MLPAAQQQQPQQQQQGQTLWQSVVHFFGGTPAAVPATVPAAPPQAPPQAAVPVPTQPGTVQLNRAATRRLLLSTVIMSTKSGRRAFHDTMDSLARVCPFWKSIVENPLFHDEVSITLQQIDPLYPYRLNIRPIPVTGIDDTRKVLAMAAMHNRLYVLFEQRPFELNVFDTTPLSDDRRQPLTADLFLLGKFKVGNFPEHYRDYPTALQACVVRNRLYITVHRQMHLSGDLSTVILVLNTDNYSITARSVLEGVEDARLTISHVNGNLCLSDWCSNRVLEYSELDRLVTSIKFDTSIRNRRAPIRPRQIQYLQPLFGDHQTYLFIHRHPNSESLRWQTLSPTNSSVRLSRIRYNPTEDGFDNNALFPIKIEHRYHKHSACRLAVLNIAANGEVVILLTRNGQQHSRIVLLDADMKVKRYMGVVPWSAEIPGRWTVDRRQRRLYFIAGEKMWAARCWRTYAH